MRLLKDNNCLLINDNDNCAVALSDISIGDTVFGIKALDDIKSGHKIALKNIEKDGMILKYGYPIGHALTNIKQGQHIHTHNIKTNLSGVNEYNYNPVLTNTDKQDNHSQKTFLGYVRENGKIGIRNEIWIINTVGCVNKVASKIAKITSEKHKDSVDGIYTFEHPFGCSQLGDDHLVTQMILKNMVNHPNACGVLVLSLGCENNNLNEFKKVLGEIDERRVKFLAVQDVSDEIDEAVKLIDELVSYAKTFKREQVSVGNLVIGLKCGGSDGFSGITANPLVGRLSDIMINYGGSCVLTEVPEMFGAEQILMNRCTAKELFHKTVDMINDFKQYFIKYDQEIYENPSPGNKEGGISTLEDKSLGCTQKAGESAVVDVLNYGDVVTEKGLNLLNGPGNDLVAITNLMAAHCHIILFTTGRGTPVGTSVPTIKISSNTYLYNKKRNWIDFNAGELVEEKNMDIVANELFDYILEVAEGKRTTNEINDYREISIFKNGVTL